MPTICRQKESIITFQVMVWKRLLPVGKPQSPHLGVMSVVYGPRNDTGLVVSGFGVTKVATTTVGPHI